MPQVPDTIATATGSLFKGLSAARGKRIFHPDGRVFEGTFTPWVRSAKAGVEILDQGPRPVLVRCSRALGLPQPAPDILGFAIRFPDAYGADRHQDLLCVTSIDAPVGHHALVPTRGFFSRPYSTLLAYRLPEGIRLFGVLPRDRGTNTFVLALAPLSRRFDGVGSIALGEQIPPAEGERLRFNPWNCGGGIRPTGPLMGIRDAAYRGSQKGAAT
jgi:hypothetical protein